MTVLIFTSVLRFYDAVLLFVLSDRSTMMAIIYSGTFALIRERRKYAVAKLAVEHPSSIRQAQLFTNLKTSL